MFTETIAQHSIAEFAGDVRAGLTKPGQKELPSNYFYDEVGSALFEAITLLPEYGLTRADERLLRQHAEAMVQPLLPAPVVVAELGSGSGKKTRWILEALARRQRTTYYPIEISPSALAKLDGELGQLDQVSIVGVESAYLEGLAFVAANRQPGERLLVLFLGSTIGNFGRLAGEQFLEEVRRRLAPGDALLLGTDLVKPARGAAARLRRFAGRHGLVQSEFAGADQSGVGGGFRFERRSAILVRYDAAERRIEMHLVSRRGQKVSIPGAGCRISFRGGETIWTESSYKYDADEIIAMSEAAGFREENQWVDEEWPFAESLLIAK